MKCVCPACGRKFPVAPDQLGFLSRCEKCNVLVRTRLRESGDEEPESTSVVARIVQVGRTRELQIEPQGTLADLLSRKAALTAMAAVARKAPVISAQPDSIDQARRHALSRIAALKRAELRGKQHLLGMFSVAGMTVIAALTLCAIFLKSHPLFSPRNSRASVVHVKTTAAGVQGQSASGH